VSETSPTPTTPPPSTGPVLPKIDPRELVATAIAVVKNPTEFFKGKKGETGFVNCLVFSVAAAVVYGALVFLSTLLFLSIAAGFGFAITAAIGALIWAVVTGIVGPFFGGLIVWGVSLIFGSKAPYEPSVRIAAYSMAVLPVVGVCSFVPVLGALAMLAAGLYSIYIAIMGARVLNFDAPPTATPTA
jgi:hypothetical protein